MQGAAASFEHVVGDLSIEIDILMLLEAPATALARSRSGCTWSKISTYRDAILSYQLDGPAA